MSHAAATILISGAGQLGSRYLQGLANCRMPLRIYVQDIYEASLGRAEQRWNEALGPESHHDASFHSSFESLPRQLDVAVVATTADVRPRVVDNIASLSAVRFWVLEKVLAQNETGLDQIVAHVKGASGAWVNTPRRMMTWHQQIKANLGLSRPVKLSVEGSGWGMACNAVHFFDLLAWWAGEKLLDVGTGRLDPHWIKSKRPGNWEVMGTLEARFSGGSHALLSASGSDGFPILKVNDGHLTWLVNEAEGRAQRSDGIEISGRNAYQSEMSAGLVETILENGDCELPTLEESTALHRVFIHAMLAHWRQAGNPAASFVPIT